MFDKRTIAASLRTEAAKREFHLLYGGTERTAAEQADRYEALLTTYAEHFGCEGEAPAFFSSPGRTEIVGNHTDHNNGLVLAAAVTLDTLAALKLAKQRGAKTLAVVNVVGSSIARAADAVLYTYAGPEIAVASTKAYSVQMAVMYLFALRLALAKGVRDESEIRYLTGELMRAGELIRPLLEECENVKFLASRFMNSDHLFFMGRGMDYALSLEGSLKLKEISYVHSEAYAAGELKHGTISLITKGTPVVAIATQDSVYEKTISNVREARSRGARVILLCKEGAAVPEDAADYIIRLPQFESLLMPLLMIVPLQLFAYYVSVLRGCDVDKPRNLAKSVTVE